MKIDENVIEKNFVLEKDDPYGFAMGFIDKMTVIGQVIERKNEYMTDGPEHRSTIEFDVVDVVDQFSRIQMSVFMQSTQKNLSINITGSFDVSAEENGFMSSMLSEFYLQNMYPAVRKFSLEKMKRIEKFVEENIS